MGLPDIRFGAPLGCGFYFYAERPVRPGRGAAEIESVMKYGWLHDYTETIHSRQVRWLRVY